MATVTPALFVSKSLLMTHCFTVRPPNVGSRLRLPASLLPTKATLAPHKTRAITASQARLIADQLLPPNSDYTDHPSVYQSMLISFTSRLLQGVSNEKQRRVNLAITEKRGIAAIRELCRTRHALRQAFSMRLRDSTVALPRRWDCVSTELHHQETHERGYDQG
jgi:hypothetical protein